ncbi:XisH family protein [Floridanema aerugineum]|uniref:XisH family protein n=1 Tax=Floridaenema aerugineum BLCC-F46 TaxID=3153654 RepID=A0ABV4WYD6_9CYAN
MPAKDLYHDIVRRSLEKDGWIITDDPLKLKIGLRELFVDLGAKQLLAAQKEEYKIAVEIKSFIGLSPVADLENALGQFTLYSDILEELDPDRVLYLAVRQEIFDGIFEEAIGKILLKKGRLRLLVFHAKKEEIIQWIP